MSFNGVMQNCPRELSIRERYETLVPYKSDLGLFMSLENLNPGDTLEHEQWQDIIMACKIIAEKNNYFEDLGKLKNTGVYGNNIDKPVKASFDDYKECYFYVNKSIWCEKYKNYIIKALYLNPVYLVLDTKSGEKLAFFQNVAKFKENYNLIETLIDYNNNDFEERYKRIVESNEFKRDYHDKSLGEFISVDK